MADNWTTIVPGDASTLPTAADGRVLMRFIEFDIENVQTRWWSDVPIRAVAWMPIPPYTPPEPVKPTRRQWRSDAKSLLSVSIVAFCNEQATTTHLGCNVHIREVLPGDMDPDAAIRLRELASEVVRKHDAGTLGGSGDSRSINELREAVK